jgi:hypothetical protein
MSKAEDPKWFNVLYEWLPFYSFVCGIMGHSEVECPNPVPENDLFFVQGCHGMIMASYRMMFSYEHQKTGAGVCNPSRMWQ